MGPGLRRDDIVCVSTSLAFTGTTLRVLMHAVIPGRASSREPGIHGNHCRPCDGFRACAKRHPGMTGQDDRKIGNKIRKLSTIGVTSRAVQVGCAVTRSNLLNPSYALGPAG